MMSAAIIDLGVGLATEPYIRNTDGPPGEEKLITGSNLNTESLNERRFFKAGRSAWAQLR